MAIANIVHSGYGFRCTATDRAAADVGSRRQRGAGASEGIPDGWLVEALDQLFVAAPALTGITCPGRPGRMNPGAGAV
jgi:acetyl CoA:N6-hydroxylysine acetyl transferase